MSSPTTCRDLLKLLSRSQIVPEERLKSYLRSRRSQWKNVTDPGVAAKKLLADGVVSHFQAQQILRGKCKGFWIKKYLVLETLGAGGMSQVLLCEQTPMNRLVAVKVLHGSTEPGAIERFEREARAVASLDHPNIVRAIDIDHDDRFHFLVMEYVDGIDLQDLVDKHGRLETGRACHYIAQAALGLQHAHEAGWVHRDIKAGNLLVDRGGTVKILDLGLARLTTDHHDQITRKFDDAAIIGTADYLAPEQSLPGEKIDARADIYSLGITFYFLLTGKTPFGAGSVLQKIVAHQVKKPRPISKLRPDLPEELTGLIEKMMAKSPARRPRTARDVAAALRPFVTAKSYPLRDDECVEHCPRVRQLLQAAAVSSAELPAISDAPPQAKDAEESEPSPIPPARRRWSLFLVGGAVAFFGLVLVAGVLWWAGPRFLGTGVAGKELARDKRSNEPEVVPGIISPEQAQKALNKVCAVQMVVASTGLSKNQKLLFLNSQVNYRAPNNFAIVATLDVEGKEAEALAAGYEKKTIRATGKVTRLNQQWQIVVDNLRQVEILTEPEKK